MDLRDVIGNIIPEIQMHMSFLTAEYPMKDCGDVFERLSELYHGLGICYLLITADTNKFRENLIHSGQARRYFLRKSQEQGNVRNRHLALSRSEAFLDSVVAGDLNLASDIARLSSEIWEGNWEYEDDFCFFLFLHVIVKKSAALPLSELQRILEQFEKSLEGGDSMRLDVCKALLMKDKKKFIVALQHLLEEKQEKLGEERPLVMESRFLYWPSSFVCVEGLALLKVAELICIQIDDEFALCPSEARQPAKGNKYRDLFMDLERALAADREGSS